MLDQPQGAGCLTVVVVSLVTGLVAGMLGTIAVLRFDDMEIVQTALTQLETPTPHATPTATQPRVTLSPTPTVLPTPSPTPLPDLDEVTTGVVRRNLASVVTVVNLRTGSDGEGSAEPKALGSGIVFDREGYIVTNEHVVRDADSLRVVLPNGEEAVGTRVGVDELTDLAVVRVDGVSLTPVTFGASSDLQPGQRVIAIGSALGGFRNTVTAGVVSGLGRQVVPKDQEYALENLIQTDAAINRGNSGGPLLDMQGEAVGVVTILIRRERDSEEIVQGIGFAIPSSTVRDIVPQLIAEGRVRRPYLGVEAHMVTPDIKATYALSVDQGARVEAVVAGSPAEAAGLRHGDVILSIDGEAINEDNPFMNVLMRRQIGEGVELRVNRVGEELTLVATLGERPEA
ncbi:MAG: Serine protease Do-like HtrA [Anaerolineales bacterium]|nr:Serine protease Do-like HtrA [Anaerolineales bacterium]